MSDYTFGLLVVLGFSFWILAYPRKKNHDKSISSHVTEATKEVSERTQEAR